MEDHQYGRLPYLLISTHIYYRERLRSPLPCKDLRKVHITAIRFLLIPVLKLFSAVSKFSAICRATAKFSHAGSRLILQLSSLKPTSSRQCIWFSMLQCARVLSNSSFALNDAKLMNASPASFQRFCRLPDELKQPWPKC